MPPYRDLADNDENTRIGIIINELLGRPAGSIIGVIVDAEPDDAKAKRYLQKLQTRCAEVQLVDITSGPTKGATLLRVKRVSWVDPK